MASPLANGHLCMQHYDTYHMLSHSHSPTHKHIHSQSPIHDPSTTSPVTSYVITYKEGGTGNSQQQMVPSTSPNVTLEGLKKGTQYEVTVTPFNEVGEGKTSQSVAETAVDTEPHSNSSGEYAYPFLHLCCSHNHCPPPFT